ncbi:MAG: hypothetical protein EOO77_24435 [Oxalobacteraceae bacterium]|nr:MAG: hypothetical protein EOO77_24435 [Oxalobacteraceae bacterium]
MLRPEEANALVASAPQIGGFIRPLYGSKEFISSSPRSCLWITKETLDRALEIPEIAKRVDAVEAARREKKSDAQAQKLVDTPYRFRDQYVAKAELLVVPIVSSENRPYLPVGLVEPDAVVHNKAFALYDAPLWNMALIASRLHLIWIATVCVRLRTDYSYSNTLGWNTFPVPTLTDKNKADLTRCAEDITLVRESYFPASIADLYEVKEGISQMPADLRDAHDRNDEVLERIYIGRRFRNDTERLQKLFEMYAKSASPSRSAKKQKVGLN